MQHRWATLSLLVTLSMTAVCAQPRARTTVASELRSVSGQISQAYRENRLDDAIKLYEQYVALLEATHDDVALTKAYLNFYRLITRTTHRPTSNVSPFKRARELLIQNARRTPIQDQSPSGLDEYGRMVQATIKKHWGGGPGECSGHNITVNFAVDRTGEVTKLELPTGQPDSCVSSDIAALILAAPFGPLPQGAPAEVGISFTFSHRPK